VIDDVETRVARVLADIFSVPVDEISAETSPETIMTWDSVQHLILVLALEEELGLSFEPEDVERMTSVTAILEVVDRTARLQLP
jgi:acyl carrier protein